MRQRRRWMWTMVMVVGILAMAGVAGAATSTGSGFYLEELAVKVFNMTKNVLIPLLLIGGAAYAGGTIAFGWAQPGATMTRVLLGSAIALGGIETIFLLVGGSNQAVALVL